jgi:hypothetical protein
MTDDIPDEPEPDGDYVDPDIPTEPKLDEEGGPALSPEELDIADSEYVEKLDDDGRYVVSPGGGPPNVPDSEGDRSGGDERTGATRGSADGRPAPSRPDPSVSDRGSGPERRTSPELARSRLAEELSRSNARYGLDIVAEFKGETARHRTVSDDVIATFENLVRWYASHVTDGTPPDEVVDILLRESTFETDETPNLAKLLNTHGLERTDSIEELVSAIREEAGR